MREMSVIRRWAIFWAACIGMGIIIAAGLVLLAAATARAQTGTHGDGHAENHDWYRGLQTPHGYSCCNARVDGKGGDCRPVQARPRDDGSWEAYFGGRWQTVPPERILADRFNRVPLHAHICEQDGFVRCFLRGGGGT